MWQSLYEELKAQNFEIISAAQDTGGEAAAGTIFDKANVTYTAIIDVNHTISSLYNLVNVPSGIWIDETGRIVRIDDGAYTEHHNLLGNEFGSDAYVPALRDWLKNGADSPYIWSAKKVASSIRQRTPDEALAEPTFKLGVYFHGQQDTERANTYWDKAQALHPDSWNFHRQDWSFLPPEETNKNFMAKVQALTKTYYAPIDMELPEEEE